MCTVTIIAPRRHASAKQLQRNYFPIVPTDLKIQSTKSEVRSTKNASRGWVFSYFVLRSSYFAFPLLDAKSGNYFTRVAKRKQIRSDARCPSWPGTTHMFAECRRSKQCAAASRAR